MATELASMDVEVRLPRLRAVMSEAGAQAPVDTLVVTNLTNIRYLTGFTGSAAVLVVAPDATILITDGRYAEQASTQVRAAGAEATVEIVPGPEQHRRLMALLGGTRRVGLEAESITWAQARRLAERPAETVATAGLVEGLRLVKDRCASPARATVRTRALRGRPRSTAAARWRVSLRRPRSSIRPLPRSAR